MFPVYPLFAFAAALAVREGLATYDKWTIQKTSVFPSVTYTSPAEYAGYAVVGLTALLSLSRVLCLALSYSAPMDAFVFLNAHLVPLDAKPVPPSHATVLEPSYRVCMGKEWYRFPSSYFLLDSTPVILETNPALPKRKGGAVELAFLKSDFTGQLPQPYLHLSHPENTAAHREGFNDLNEEEHSRYVDLSTCDYVIDIELPAAEVNEEPYFNSTSPLSTQFVSLWSQPFLHNPSSPFPFRSLYIPGVSTARNVYGTYHVLANAARVAGVEAPKKGKKAKVPKTATVIAAATPTPTATPEAEAEAAGKTDL